MLFAEPVEEVHRHRQRVLTVRTSRASLCILEINSKCGQFLTSILVRHSNTRHVGRFVNGDRLFQHSYLLRKTEFKMTCQGSTARISNCGRILLPEPKHLASNSFGLSLSTDTAQQGSESI